MLRGIGTDIVRVARMEQNLSRYGRRFAARILHDMELVEFDRSAQPARFLAKRFAAKEAAAKAFGTGFRDGLSLRHLRVDHDSLGRPLLSCSDKAAELMVHFAVSASHLSISDEEHYAVAFVVLEGVG